MSKLALTLAEVIDGPMRSSGKYLPKTLREASRTVRRYEKFAGATQHVHDVTREKLEDFIAWQLSNGYKLHDSHKMAGNVAWIVRFVAPDKLPRWVRHRPADGETEAAVALTNWPLVRVVNQLCKPTGTRAGRTIVKYRQACRRYCRFKGDGQRVCDVTVETVEEFREWQVKQGYSEGVADSACEHLATVVRRADQSRLPKKYRRPAFADADRKAFADADTDGSLESIMLNDYFPSRSRINNPMTEKQYAWAVARFSSHLGHVATLADLTDVKLGRWMRAMRDDGLEAKTINGYMNKLRAFWTWAAKRRLVNDFPTIENMPEPRRIPRAWTREQLEKLFAATSTMPGVVADVPAGQWWRALHLVAWDTGARKSELLNLRWEDFDAATGYLEAPAEIRKGGKKSALYQLKPATVAAVEAIREPQRLIIFHWDRDAGSFHLHYKRLVELAGLPWERRRCGLQKLRRTFASFIENAGGNATAALDHTARKVTVESYLDPRVIKSPPPNAILFDLDASD